MLKLIGDKVLIQAIHDPSTTRGGIIIPDRHKGRIDQGIVKYTGPDCKWLKPKDYVIFSGYQGTLINMEGEGSMILTREPFIAAIGYPKFESTPVPGLFFYAGDGEYFPATYEQAMQLMVMAIADHPDHKHIRDTHWTPPEMETVE